MKRKIILMLCALATIATVCIGCGGKTAETDTDLNVEEAEEGLTIEEEFAVEYLLTFADYFKSPRSIELYNVWIAQDTLDRYYITLSLSSENDFGGRVEGYYGNQSFYSFAYPATEEDDEYFSLEFGANQELVLGGGKYFAEGNTDAKNDGVELDAEKIQEAFFERYK